MKLRRWTVPRTKSVDVGDAISVDTSTGSYTLDASNIGKVEFYKTDHVTIDVVWIRLESVDGDVLTVNEDSPEFKPLEEWCQTHLPGFDTGWRGKALQEPFAENRTIAYRRSA